MNYLICLVFLLTSSCSFNFRKPNSESAFLHVIEDVEWYEDKVKTTSDPQLPLNLDKNLVYLDLRGMGDSAHSYGATPAGGSSTPMPATFDKTLLKYDPRSDLFVGDLSFINFETVVGEKCEKIRQSVDYYFLTNPKSITQAIDHGFNIIGAANNHSQDCNLGKAFLTSTSKHGALMTEESLNSIKPKNSFVWSGVGAQKSRQIVVKEMLIKNKKIKVALGSVALLTWDIPNANVINFMASDVDEKISDFLKGFDTVAADLKIVSIHTQDPTGHNKPEREAFLTLKKIATRFIEEHDGDVAMGHGPHTYGGVKMVEKKDHTHGVIFTSLGNFIHDGLGSNPDNYIGRVIFDFEKKKIKQLQVLNFTNNKKTEAGKIPVTYYDEAELKNIKGKQFKRLVNSNFDWRIGNFLDHDNKNRGLYFATFE